MRAAKAPLTRSPQRPLYALSRPRRAASAANSGAGRGSARAAPRPNALVRRAGPRGGGERAPCAAAAISFPQQWLRRAGPRRHLAHAGQNRATRRPGPLPSAARSAASATNSGAVTHTRRSGRFSCFNRGCAAPVRARGGAQPSAQRRFRGQFLRGVAVAYARGARRRPPCARASRRAAEGSRTGNARGAAAQSRVRRIPGRGAVAHALRRSRFQRSFRAAA
jgi:hypothetical protein